MSNRECDHMGNHNFRVEIEGITVGAFMEVSGLESSVEVLESADGDAVRVHKRPGRTRYSNIVLRRGFTNSDELWKWHKAVTTGEVERKSGSIILCDDKGAEVMRYNFFEAWPCRWKSAALSARDRTTLVEELEIVVELFERG